MSKFVASTKSVLNVEMDFAVRFKLDFGM